MHRHPTARKARPGASSRPLLRAVPAAQMLPPGRDYEGEVVALEQEVATLRSLRQRDQAMARGLGYSLQELRRGALALREDNEELRRALHAARSKARR